MKNSYSFNSVLVFVVFVYKMQYLLSSEGILLQLLQNMNLKVLTIFSPFSWENYKTCSRRYILKFELKNNHVIVVLIVFDIPQMKC